MPLSNLRCRNEASQTQARPRNPRGDACLSGDAPWLLSERGGARSRRLDMDRVEAFRRYPQRMERRSAVDEGREGPVTKLCGVRAEILDEVEAALPIDGDGVRPSDLRKHFPLMAPTTLRKAFCDLVTLGRVRFEGVDGNRRYWRAETEGVDMLAGFNSVGA